MSLVFLNNTDQVHYCIPHMVFDLMVYPFFDAVVRQCCRIVLQKAADFFDTCSAFVLQLRSVAQYVSRAV